MSRPVAVYIHVPFCKAKCAYCDFASFVNRLCDAQRYFDVLCDEIRSWKDALNSCEIQTVFFGGGTPTLVDAEYIVRTMETLRECALFSDTAEITLEGNPGTLSIQKLKTYREIGVNRLSMGAQSMNDNLLRSIGRIHTAQEVAEAVQMARDCGFKNINLDLIYALPNQTLEDWKHTLNAACALNVEHISAYSLIVEEGTAMYDRIARGECNAASEDMCIEMQRTATQILAQNGYARYEISNYAKSGFECRHNQAYWRRGEYLGFGCAAHSMFGGKRFENPRDLNAYLSGVRHIREETLTVRDALEETLMLGLRLCTGISLSEWKRNFGFALEEKETVRMLIRSGLMEADSNGLRLTERGMEVQDAIVIALLE